MAVINIYGIRKLMFFRSILYPTSLSEACASLYLSTGVSLGTRSFKNTALSALEVKRDVRTNQTKSQTKSTNQEQSDSFGSLKSSIEYDRYKSSHSKDAFYGNQAQKNKKVIRIKRPVVDEGDVFGNLSEKKPMWYPDLHEEPKPDNDLSDDSVIVKNLSKRYRRPEVYLHEMKCLVKKKKVKEALDLFVDMRRHFVTPIKPHYTFMIGACGRVGYTEMAFKLLRQMTDRSLQPTPAVLTGLFNACAESPFPEYGLKKARSLREKIKMKNWELNQISYHAMIKAFGKCGDLITAFEIVDEMAEADIKIDAQTYNFLLMSCIDNKEAGFTYAVEVWRKMKSKQCLPNVFTCNLLLRATRDCDIGTQEISSLLLQHWSSYSKRPYGFVTKESLSKTPVLQLAGGNKNLLRDSGRTGFVSDSGDSNGDKKLEADDFKENHSPNDAEAPKFELDRILNTSVAFEKVGNTIPSLLSVRPTDGPEILELVNIKTATDRLALIGGMEGFLEFMFKAKVKPNIKTLTLMLDCIPSDCVEEQKLIDVLEKHQIKPDIDFFNMLIKKRNFRKDTESARAVLVYVNRYELTPNILTFGVLALGCRNFKQATTFIEEMTKYGSCPNIEIAGALLNNACCIFDFHFMKYVLELMEVNEIKANEKVLALLDKTLKIARKNITAKEQGEDMPQILNLGQFSANFSSFSNFYEEWKKRIIVQTEEHPWEQYKTEIIDKPKVESVIEN